MALHITTFNCENLFGRYAILDKPPAGTIKNFEKLFQIPEVVAFEPAAKARSAQGDCETQRKTTGAAISGR